MTKNTLKVVNTEKTEDKKRKTKSIRRRDKSNRSKLRKRFCNETGAV
jgi:hypothetical protein